VGIGIPKYQKYWEIPKFNSIEYRKCSIPNFQYYWMLKTFQYWSSIIPKFSILVPKIPNFPMSWILRIFVIFNLRFFFKIYCNLGYFRYISVFFGIFRYFPVFFGISGIFRDSIPKIFDIEKKIEKKISKIFRNFLKFFEIF